MQSKIAIIGRGYVGQAYHKFFPEAVMYNRHGETNQDEVNQCDLAIVCVPTVMKKDGSCDTSIVEEVVSWLEAPLILIKSTIPPGTTKRLKEKYGKRICHSPEYVGEGGYYVPFWLFPHPTEPQHHSFMIIGGDQQDRDDMLDYFYPVLGATKTYLQVDETTSELIKYMENCAIAAKVTLCNEFYELAKAFGVSYSQLREGFVLDERQGKMFTAVYKNRRGFDGKCLPKDLNAIIQASLIKGYFPGFLLSILENNQRLRKEQQWIGGDNNDS
jgi:UDPglucose 6-dehydrogenase